MKVNSEKLWDYIFNLATDEKVRFKVYCDDIYFAEILWNGEEFEWESGTFTSRAFFNPMYDFVPIEEEKEIEKIDNEHDYYCYTRYDSFENDIDKVLYLINGINATNDRITDTNLKLNELIDEVKKLKEE